MPELDEFAFLDATAQAELVRRKEVEPIELLEAAIKRVELLNPQINAVITPMYDLARDAIRQGLPEGPFRGVPFLLKDILASYAGVPLTCGSEFLRDAVADHDGELVKRYKRAGLVILGKTNVPEFGSMHTTEPRAFGPCRNPWDLERSVGGSSGGSAAAVASGMVSVAHGNDGAGSIRVPAACCGLFGLKTTRGRVPSEASRSLHLRAVDHVLARTLRDSAALLDATCGPEPGAPYFAPPPERPFLDEVGADPGRLRIAFTTTSFVGPVHPECSAAVEGAVALCSELGHEMIEGAPEENLLPDGLINEALAGSAMGITRAAAATGQEPTPDKFEPTTWWMYQTGLGVSAVDLLKAQEEIDALCRRVAPFWADIDVWLTPANTVPPPPLGSFFLPDGNVNPERTRPFVPYLPLANWTGQPAMSVPLHWTADGLPMGVHFMGRYGDEATLLRLAAQLEEARPWADRRPPVPAGL